MESISWISLFGICSNLKSNLIPITLYRQNAYNLYQSSNDSFRINFSLLADIASIVPLDYISWLMGYPQEWFRCIRFIKVYCLYNIASVLKTLFKSSHFFNIVLLFILCGCASHIFGCIFYVIALFEFNRGGRFDGKSLVRISSNNF